ncbi:MAG: hypothetical protein ACYTBJ_17915 [Planctomycetota bacterium]
MKTESRFGRKACKRGAHGYMQVQLRSKSCDYQAYLRASWLNLYRAMHNIDRGASLMKYWQTWCNKHHRHLAKRHHWLLHYNQGFGVCPKSNRRCKYRHRIPITTGKLGGYARRVLKSYHRLRSLARANNS